MLTVDLFGPEPNGPPPVPPDIRTSTLTQPPTVTNKEMTITGATQFNHDGNLSSSRINHKDTVPSPTLENSVETIRNPESSSEDDVRNKENFSGEPVTQNEKGDTTINHNTTNTNSRKDSFPKMSSNFDKAPKSADQSNTSNDNTKDGANIASQAGAEKQMESYISKASFAAADQGKFAEQSKNLSGGNYSQ